MKLFFRIHCILLATVACSSCSSDSRQYESNAMECWGKAWLPTTDPSGEMFWNGIDSLDKYLHAQGYLGSGMPADYMKFADDTTPIVIPPSTPGYHSMQMAIHSDFAGAPDVNAMANCINENVTAHINEMDSSDVLVRFSRLFKAMGQAGAPDANGFRNFYLGLTKEEMDRPLIKTMFYFMFGYGRGQTPKIQIEAP